MLRKNGFTEATQCFIFILRSLILQEAEVRLSMMYVYFFTGERCNEVFNSQNPPQKKRCKNPSKNQCLLGSIFGAILMDFSSQNGAKLVAKWEQKSISTSNGVFSKNFVFPNEK